ncbi:MAG TPA: carbohydrate-binding family 9-like protein [Verrucomicrobiae bacterium]|nr:carbohydrate-binding family 9-like protein [Verrucomicrobiae bacterium]
MNYAISRIAGDFTDEAWSGLAAAEVNQFLPQSSNHRPRTLVRVAHDGQNLVGRFEVEDRFVRSVRTEYGSEVWKDSCVEFFVEPKPGRGYFNFEFNCGGAFLVNHIIDPTRTPNGFKDFTRLPASVAKQVKVRTSLPQIVQPEITEPITWTLEFRIPFSVFDDYVGPLGKVAGETWHGNFFKCAEENSHPHWAAWSPVSEFNFHVPQCFGTLRLI